MILQQTLLMLQMTLIWKDANSTISLDEVEYWQNLLGLICDQNYDKSTLRELGKNVINLIKV